MQRWPRAAWAVAPANLAEWVRCAARIENALAGLRWASKLGFRVFGLLIGKVESRRPLCAIIVANVLWGGGAKLRRTARNACLARTLSST